MLIILLFNIKVNNYTAMYLVLIDVFFLVVDCYENASMNISYVFYLTYKYMYARHICLIMELLQYRAYLCSTLVNTP